MKPKRRALSKKNYPRNLDFQFYAVVWLLMDRLTPPMWIWGMVGTPCAILFIAAVIDFLARRMLSCDTSPTPCHANAQWP